MLRWSNDAGVSWSQAFDWENGILRGGKDCAYYESEPVRGRAFRPLGERDPDSGEWRRQPIGFQFLADSFYRTL